MTRNLKTLGLALMSVLALSAVAAPFASAAEEEHSAAAETTVTGIPDGALATAHHVIDLAGASITCPTLSLDGTMKAAVVSELTMTFAYTGCKFLGQNTVVDPGECEFILTFKGELDIGSLGGGNCNLNPIRITGPSCEVRIGTQKNLKGLKFHNINNKTEVTMEMAINGLTYTAEGAGCPKAGVGLNDGVYTTGNTILTGEDPKTGVMIPIWWE